MYNVIPFFYADLIARVVPGAVLLAIIRLINLPQPAPWIDWAPSLGKGEVVLVPLVYAGLAYALGTMMEVLSGRLLERLYVHAFRCVSKTYPWLTRSQSGKSASRCPKDLSRATFSAVIVGAPDQEKQIVSHLVRFHSEAKMSFHISVSLALFLLIAAIDAVVHIQLLKNLENPSFFYWFAAFLMLLLMWVSFERLRSRAVFVFRAIDSLGAGSMNVVFKSLRTELRKFSR